MLAALVVCGRTLAQAPPPVPVIVTPHGDNAPAQRDKPYVILVSLDGFRYDYARRYGARNLQALGRRGASAPDGLIPVFPSITFPNHYSILLGIAFMLIVYGLPNGVTGLVASGRRQWRAARQPAP